MSKFLKVLTILLATINLMAKTVTLNACDWEPYTGEKLVNYGFLSELTTEVLQEEGYSVTIAFYPWARSFDNVKNGQVDGLIGASHNEEREAYFSFPEKLWTSDIGVWCLKDNPITQFSSLEKLAPAKIGVLNGSFLIDEIKKVKGLEADIATQVELNIKKLAAGRMPYFIESYDAVKMLLNTKYSEYNNSIKMLLPAYKEDHLYVVFSKKSPNWQQLTKDFNNGLKKLKENGMYQKIVQKHKMK